jgi:broad specificity phosphatase PhoE
LIQIKDITEVFVSVRGIRRPTLSVKQSLRGWNEASSSLFLTHWATIFLTDVKVSGCPAFAETRYFDGSMPVTATFLLIRHAAHVHLDRRLSGRMDGVPLSADGDAQAAALGRALAARQSSEPIGRIVCSPLERTRDTAAAIAAACALPPPEPIDALVEIDMGDWTGAAFTDLHGPEWDAWNTQRGTARIPGGETMVEAQARIVGFLKGAAAQQDGAVIALVSHSDMIRAAIAFALGLPLDHLLRFDIDPASVSRIVVGEWGGRVVSLNERMAA